MSWTPQMLCSVPQGTVLLAHPIPNTYDGGFWPHVVDLYVPNGTIASTLTCLPGGGATGRDLARQLFLTWTDPPTAQTTWWTLPHAFRTAMAFVTGMHCTGVTNTFNPNGANTVNSLHPTGTPMFSNWHMWSQYDDVKFLHDLGVELLNLFPATGRLIMGHSAGGFQVNRIYTENPSYYSHYATISGPRDQYYRNVVPTGFQAGSPPYRAQYGQLDDTLNITGGPAGSGMHFFEEYWYQGTKTLSPADRTYPQPGASIGEWTDLQARVTATGSLATINQSDGVVSAVAVGNKTTWTYNTVQVVLYDSAGHDVKSQRNAAGVTPLTDIMRWMFNT